MRKADLIARIEKLETLRSQIAEAAIGQGTGGTVERTKPEVASNTLETKKTPPATPVQQHGVNGNGDMPKSLEGISALDLSLLDLDVMLTGEEQVWYNKRKIKALGRDRHRTSGPNDWMAM